MGQNIFFSIDNGRKTLTYMIPAEAFSSLQQYKDVKKYIKKAVKEQQRPENKTSVLGQFFRAMFGAWFRYVLFMLKMAMIWLLVGGGFLLIIAVLAELKK